MSMHPDSQSTCMDCLDSVPPENMQVEVDPSAQEKADDCANENVQENDSERQFTSTLDTDASNSHSSATSSLGAFGTKISVPMNAFVTGLSSAKAKGLHLQLGVVSRFHRDGNTYQVDFFHIREGLSMRVGSKNIIGGRQFVLMVIGIQRCWRNQCKNLVTTNFKGPIWTIWIIERAFLLWRERTVFERRQLELQKALTIQRWWRPRCVATFLDEIAP